VAGQEDGFDVVVRRVGDTVWVSGDVDARSAPAFRQGLVEAVAQAATVDLTAVPYLDSAGIAVLFELAAAGLQLRVRAGSAVARVMEISGLAQIPTVEIVRV
jgi:RNA polymerase sigma-B factor